MCKISLLLPVYKYSFFPQACLKNVFETFGDTDKLDFVLLTNNNCSLDLPNTKEHPCRVLSAPFDCKGRHQLLLDWAFLNDDKLSKWVIIQHCDLFWTEKNWSEAIFETIEEHPNSIAIRSPHGEWEAKKFELNNKTVPLLHDFAGVYNRHQVREKKLSFNCGVIGSEIPLSNAAMIAIKTKKLTWAGTGRSKSQPKSRNIVAGLDFLDGSESMAIECAVRFPELVENTKLPCFHVWQFFRISKKIHIVNDTLKVFFDFRGDLRNVDEKNLVLMLKKYSYISSFLIELEEIKDHVLPWSVIKSIKSISPDDSCVLDIEKHMSIYGSAKNVLGDGDMGIKKVQFNNLKLFKSHSGKFVPLKNM